MGVRRKFTDTDLPTEMKCSECGTTYELGLHQVRTEIHDIMKEHSLCFTCAFWKKILDKEVDYTIIEGKCYLVNQKPSSILTNKSVKFSYLMNPYFHVRFLGIIKFYGEVPPHLKQKLPDEGIFVTREIYYKGLSGCWKCSSKGCWDRYRCLRYDINIEKDGPWNTVPNNHIIGSEGCYSFIDKKTFGL